MELYAGADGVLQNGLGDRMFGPGLESRRDAENFIRRRPVQRDDVHDARCAARQRAGLVKRHAPNRPGPLEMRAALDQDSLTRRRRQGRHDRDRCRDHQRARARNDEEHKTAIRPFANRPVEQRRHRHEGGGEANHRRRVVARKPVHENLDWRAASLSGFHEVDDSRERRVAAQPRDPHFECAAAIDGAGEHLVSRSLIDRQGLSGDRRLIDRAVAVENFPVERNLVTGSHNQRLANPHEIDGNTLVDTLAMHQRFSGAEIHQRANRVARARHAACLEQLCERKQENDGGPFRPFADRHCAGHREQHQDVDIEREHARRGKGPAHRVDAAGENRRDKRRQIHEAGNPCHLQTEPDGQGRP